MTYITGSKLKHGGFRDKKHCALVLDGNTVKHRLYADRIKAQTPVHVDWLRFTVALRLCPTPSVDVLFPPNAIKWKYEHERLQQFQRLLAAIPDAEFSAAAQAMELGNQVVHILGPDFDLNPELRKGHDFYRHRFSIERCGQEVGWIGFLAAGNSPKQKGQSSSLHVNLYGSACTFAEFGWRELMADLIEDLDGDITRADLALDFFDGMPGMNMDTIVDDYKAGAMNAGGKKLTCNMVGDWANGFERSFYIGTKEGGKQTNVYEKGQQLFGREAGSEWTRVELRWGNKLRVLPADILRRPADFFACASDWHTLMLSKADAIPSPAALPCKEELQIQTVQAEVTRSLRWLRDVAAPTVAFAINFMDFRELWDLIGTPQLPQRLSKFKADELKAAAAGSYERFIQPASAGPGMQVVHPLAA